MDTKHTLGTWTVEKVSPYVAEVHAEKGPVATNLTHEEARLIAAAPLMRATLKDVLDAIEGMVDIEDGSDGMSRPNWGDAPHLLDRGRHREGGGPLTWRPSGNARAVLSR
jgi:hypothetical protein